MKFIMSNSSLTVHLNKKDFTITSDNPNFNKIREAIKRDDETEVLRLVDVKTNVEARFGGNVQIIGSGVYHNGRELHGVVVDRIMQFYWDGLPFEPLLRFVENLQQNPSKTAVDELYTFLEHRHLPITEDGCFLGYKGVDNNFMDIYSGKFDNSPGKTVTMERNEVDDDKNVHCSHGLHVGTHEYAVGYAGAGRKVMVVKVNPKDCVSVPTDCNFQKLRTAGYEVLYECTNALDRPLYSNQGAARDESECNSYDDCDDYCAVDHTKPEPTNKKWLVVDRNNLAQVWDSFDTRDEARNNCDVGQERVVLNPDWVG